MSTAVLDLPGGDGASAGAAGDPTEPGARGSLHVSERVVQKIAAHIAGETGAVRGAPPTLLGQHLGAAGRRARVSATVDGRIVALTISMSVDYPDPVLEVARAVRERVRATVGELTGLEVRQVDIEVASLPLPVDAGRRVR